MQQEPIDFSPYTPELTRPDLFGSALYEESVAHALLREIHDRWNWINTEQDQNYGEEVSFSQYFKVYNYTSHIAPDERATFGRFEFIDYPNITFDALFPYQGKCYWRMKSPPVRDDAYYARTVPPHWQSCDRYKGRIVSKGPPWGNWQIEIEAQETNASKASDFWQELLFCRFTLFKGDPTRFLRRNFLHRWATQRICLPSKVLSNPQFFSRVEDETAFARSYCAMIDSGALYHHSDPVNTSLDNELLDRGLRDHRTVLHESFGGKYGIWIARISRLRDEYCLDTVTGPDLDGWFEFMNETVIRSYSDASWMKEFSSIRSQPAP